MSLLVNGDLVDAYVGFGGGEVVELEVCYVVFGCGVVVESLFGCFGGGEDDVICVVLLGY